MDNLKWQLITEWEKEYKKPYPKWGIVWSYDAYAESWEVAQWNERKDYYERERKKPINKDVPMWDFQFEPMVALPTDEHPKWGEGVSLKREVVNG